MIRFCGLDVHRKETRACVTDAAGKVLIETTLPTTREALARFAHAWLAEQTQQTAVALEATFNCWAIADVLRPIVGEGRVVVSNPLQTKAIAQAKIKTDKVDAKVLAHLLRCDYLPLVWTPDEPTRYLRRIAHRRAALVSERTRLKNRIHSVLAHNLVTLECSDLFSATGQRWLQEQALAHLDPLSTGMIQSDLRLLGAADTELAELDQQMAHLAYKEQRAKLLMTLPGVDFCVALTLLAALGDITRFRDADHAASYLGLAPSTHQSGEHCYHGPITKRGNGKARWMLIQAAQHVAEHPGPLGVFFRRQLRRKNRNVAVVATARKLVVIAWHMLTTNEPYRYAQPRPTQEKLARLRVRATGTKRKSGTAKGTPQPAYRGTGQRTRRVAALPEALAQEGLPAPRSPEDLPAGERRMLTATQTLDYARQIHQEQRLPRHSRVQADMQADVQTDQASRDACGACLAVPPAAAVGG